MPASARAKSSRRRTTRRKSQATASRWRRVGRYLWSNLRGPVGQQLAAVGLILFGLLLLFTLAGLNSGVLVNAFARLLVFLFGWGAYLIAMLFVALGLLWLRHLVHQPMVWRWRPIIGWEMSFVGLLALTHTFLRRYGWYAVEGGRAGGVVGWALSVFLITSLGSLLTLLILLLFTLLGLGLAFDLTGNDLRAFFRRMKAALHRPQAEQALPAPSPAAEEVRQLSPGVALSPTPARRKRKPRRSRKSAPARAVAPSTEGMPPISLLHEAAPLGMVQEEIERKRRIIEVTLEQFGLPAKVTEVRQGPTVTQFGLTPGYISRGENGEEKRKVRVNQIVALKDDLALALAARTVRMEAPVPGRAVVGVEVPNEQATLITLRHVLESEAYRRCEAPLCIAIGLDVAGSAVVADLGKMPHLLVAGTTGSGKSVFIKAMTVSLVMRNSPAQLRLIAIDPKIVELSRLNGLPHLLGPAITELEKALRVLRWAVVEMENRYKKLAAVSARHLDEYNRHAARRGEPTLPRIVILIDELADMMMLSPEETEKLLTRLAQKARAVGIHLVVATQRPSTDVVTGLIKANFPARLSFATASQVDSRVVLDMPGAESLLGQGDLLYLPPDAARPRRIQGCYVTDEEVEAVIEWWEAHSEEPMPTSPPWEVEHTPQQRPQALRLEGEGEEADYLERAIALARQMGSISTSAIQRRLRISYPRAARLMEEMERMGIVGPQEAAGRTRRVLLPPEEDDRPPWDE